MMEADDPQVAVSDKGLADDHWKEFFLNDPRSAGDLECAVKFEVLIHAGHPEGGDIDEWAGGVFIPDIGGPNQNSGERHDTWRICRGFIGIDIGGRGLEEVVVAVDSVPDLDEFPIPGEPGSGVVVGTTPGAGEGFIFFDRAGKEFDEGEVLAHDGVDIVKQVGTLVVGREGVQVGFEIFDFHGLGWGGKQGQDEENKEFFDVHHFLLTNGDRIKMGLIRLIFMADAPFLLFQGLMRSGCIGWGISAAATIWDTLIMDTMGTGHTLVGGCGAPIASEADSRNTATV